MKDVIASPDLVAFCGLCCGACGSYRKERCNGCAKNDKASWCKVRSCCKEHGYASCADCTEFSDPQRCRKFNNLMSRVIGFVLRSDRSACIAQIKKLGVEGHATLMAREKKQTIKR